MLSIYNFLPLTPGDKDCSLRPAGRRPLLLRSVFLFAELIGADGRTLLADTRMALCRCGRSENKPLCDGSHDGEFEDDGHLAVDQLTVSDEDGNEGPLRIRATEYGPFVVEGPVTIEGTDGEEIEGHRGALCRCGASGSKPFCDGSHAHLAFEAPGE